MTTITLPREVVEWITQKLADVETWMCSNGPAFYHTSIQESRVALRAALATEQPSNICKKHNCMWAGDACPYCKDAQVHPAQVPLTNAHVSELWEQHRIELWGGKFGINPIVFTRLIETAHGIGAKP